MATERGAYRFEVLATGNLIDNEANLEKLRMLFRDDRIIAGAWGPGDPGDFDHGSWHILCHLAAGAGVLATGAGLAWTAIAHSPVSDIYHATVTFQQGVSPQTVPLRSAEGSTLVTNASCLGFVEGSSRGHISARGVRDPASAFNGWPRQDYDRGVHDPADGGTVWEHWSTTRDIRESSAIGSSVLSAYLSLVATLGGRFVGAVARGRREHEHPRQLVALGSV